MLLILYITIVSVPAVPFEEDDKDPSIWFLDHSYLEIMFRMFKKVNGEAQQQQQQQRVVSAAAVWRWLPRQQRLVCMSTCSRRSTVRCSSSGVALVASAAATWQCLQQQLRQLLQLASRRGTAARRVSSRSSRAGNHLQHLLQLLLQPVHDTHP